MNLLLIKYLKQSTQEARMFCLKKAWLVKFCKWGEVLEWIIKVYISCNHSHVRHDGSRTSFLRYQNVTSKPNSLFNDIFYIHSVKQTRILCGEAGRREGELPVKRRETRTLCVVEMQNTSLSPLHHRENQKVRS